MDAISGAIDRKRRAGSAASGNGRVALVGAGPGDPDLLTLRAARRISEADAIVYDHLVGREILDLARRDAKLIYVGKERDNHTLPQEQINALLIRLAHAGSMVVRLKGGDPFIFGRGGEEIEALADAGIAFEVVPGVTAASGASCYAGIPLTHRDHAQTCLFVTGHLKQGGCDLDWDALVRPKQTVVIYMGLGQLGEIAKRMIAQGMRADMPVAVIEDATRASQRVVRATLETVAEAVKDAGLNPPALIVVGTVVNLNQRLAWFAGRTATAADAL
jgi:uroporphyrin-III C-methyltransferase/precorrin-2 dehydrogenase/sirohydrochlorin ferrochelatase